MQYYWQCKVKYCLHSNALIDFFFFLDCICFQIAKIRFGLGPPPPPPQSSC